MKDTLRYLYFGARHRLRLAEQWLYSRSFLLKSSLTLPDFLGIGAQKAGTTWLHVNLQHHPEVFVPPDRQDLHFFDEKQHYGVRHYSSQFAEARGKVKGENTPAYGVMPKEKVDRVRDLLPKVKILFIMRNPIQRAWSHARMALTRDGRSLEEIPEHEFVSHFRSERSRSRCDYISILDKWLSVYPRESIWVGFFDDIEDRPKEILEEVFIHIGVTRDVKWGTFPYNEIVNEGPSAPIPSSLEVELTEMYREQIIELQKRFGGVTLNWLPEKP